MRKLYTHSLRFALSFFIAAFFLPMLSQAQVKYDFNDGTGNAASISPATISASVLSTGNNTASATLFNATSATKTTDYAGASGGDNASAIAKAGAFSATVSAYFEVTLTPNTGLSLNISEIDFGSRSTGTGPLVLDIRTSLDNFGSVAATTSVLANSAYAFKSVALTLNGTVNTPVTLRIYGSGGTGNSSSANWRIDDLSILFSTGGAAGPVITGTPGNLTGLTGVTGAASNPTTTETINGTNLTDNITVAASTGFEVSTDGSTFTSSVLLPQSGGTVTAAPVQVRIASTSTSGPVSGTLTATSTGAGAQTFTLSGVVTGNLSPLQSFSATAISSAEIDLSGTGDAAGDNILVAYNTAATFGTPGGLLHVGDAVSGGGTVLYNGPVAGFSFQHTGLAAFTQYFYSAWSVDGSNNYSTSLTANATTLNPPSAKIVINQVFGGGGNSGSIYTNDFIELFNDADTAVNLSGWSVQYSSAAGTSWQVTPLHGIIQPHSFYLVQESTGNAGTTALPTPDATGTIAMAAGSGKVILCNTTVAQTGHVPAGSVVDAVAYGSSDILEGPGTAPLLSDNTTSDTRKADGLDTKNNSADFQIVTALPRNSSYTITPPVITALRPINGFIGLSAGYTPSLVFNKPVVKGSGNITLVTNGVAGTPVPIGDAGIVIGNNSTVTFSSLSLTAGNSYAITVDAGTFTDAYGNNFAGLGATAWNFTTYDPTAASPLVDTLRYDFNTCTGNGLLPNGFTQYSVLGAQVWDCTAFGRDPNAPTGTAAFPNGVQINGFANNINNTNSDWLISPRLDLTGTAFPLLGFWSRNAFDGDPLQLKISTDYSGTGDPTLATWTDLNGKFPSSGSDIWTQSFNINLSNFKQNGVYIAFVYKSTTDDGSRWTLDDISLINSATPPPPSLTLSTNNIEFGYATAGNTVDKKLTVVGNDITGDVTLSSEGSFLLSRDSLVFGSSLTLGHDTSNNVPETIFVRFQPSINNNQFIDSLHVVISDTTATINVQGNSIDPASTLSVVNWNLNWFGIADPTLGPVDKGLQETNVAIILPSLHADLYVLQEVVNTHVLDSIVSTMPGYAYVINNYGSHSNPFDSENFPLDQTQKLAFVFNTAKISNIQTDSLLSSGVNMPADVSTKYYDDWSSGRYPYMLTADVTLSDNNGGVNKKTIRFINIHGKSNLSPVLTSYQRREAGANALDSLIQKDYLADNVMILGDYNDDLLKTITTGIKGDTTSYHAFTVQDSVSYIFPTRLLSQEMQHSDVNFTSVIDNVIVNKTMAGWYLPSSATVLSDVATLVPKYGTTTTDHYPVFSQFSFTPPTSVPLPVTLLNFTAARQDASVKLSWTTTEETNSKEFDVERSGDGVKFTSIGVVAAKGNSSVSTTYNFVDQQPLSGGNYYRLKQVDLDGAAVYSKTLKVDFTPSLLVRILPNPAHGTANILLGNTTEATSIEIVDLNGRIITQLVTTAGTSNVPVDITNIAKGIYTVKVISGSSLTTQKLLVQ